MGLLALLTLALVGGVTIGLRYGLGWPWLIAYFLAVNAATFLLYAGDKAAARRQGLRVPERLLLLTGLVGGSPAALVAQRLLRHKTVKRSFRIAFWSLLVIQIGVVVAYAWWRWGAALAGSN